MASTGDGAEIDGGLANEATIIEWIIGGQFSNPVQIVAFNTAEGWSRDITEDTGRRVLDLSRRGRLLSSAAMEFLQRATGKTPNVFV